MLHIWKILQEVYQVIIIGDNCPDPEGEGSYPSIIPMLLWYNYFIP